jgi:hypothetical protein
MVKRPDITIKNEEKTCTPTDVTIPADRNVAHDEAEKKKGKVEDFLFRDTANVECEMYDYTSSNFGHRISTKDLKKKNLVAMPEKQ